MQNQSSPIVLFLTITALVSGLIFPPLSAYTAVYVTLGAMLFGLVPYWREGLKTVTVPPFALKARKAATAGANGVTPLCKHPQRSQ